MNCQLLQEITAWPCRTVTGTNGESAFVVAPPVEFWDGSLVPMYVIDRGESIEITDDGLLLQHLDASGFAVSADVRRKKSLTNALAKWGVALDDELRIGCKPQDLRQAIYRFMGALFSAAHWERAYNTQRIGRHSVVSV